MIARNTESIGCSQCSQIGFPVSEFVDWSRQCGLEKANIADAVDAAEKSKLLGVEIKDDLNIEPFRSDHFASAL